VVTGFFLRHPYATRMALTLVFFGVLSALLVAGFSTPVSMEEARATVEKLRPLFEAIIKRGDVEGTAWNVFVHNAMMTLIANTPLLGFPLMMFSAYQTGLTAKMLVMVSGRNIGFGQIYYRPHTILELLAYSMAAAESAYLTPFLMRRGRGEEKISLAPTIAVVILELSLLWAASLLESQLIISGGV